jgi:hypothetical protein
LYTNKISVDGVKLPMLSNANINKLIQYGKKESVLVYINQEMTLCEFFDNGDVKIYCEFKDPKNITTIEDFIKEFINPFIDEVKKYMEQNGYMYHLFQGLY